jgi:hypothetical protein
MTRAVLELSPPGCGTRDGAEDDSGGHAVPDWHDESCVRGGKE